MSTGVVLLVIDALNLIRRVHAASPDDALRQSVSSLKRALRQCSPTHAVSVFDGSGPTFRHELYPNYKAGRKPMPEDLRSNLDSYRDAFAENGVVSVSREELEADDVAATLATKVTERNGNAVILSTDKVYCQLLSLGVTLRDHFGNADIDESYVNEKFGVPSTKLVELWALAGSGSTHIPGIPGIGIKTGAKLLTEHETLDGVLDAAERGDIAGKVGESLVRDQALARLSAQLAALRTELSLGWNLRSFRYESKS